MSTVIKPIAVTGTGKYTANGANLKLDRADAEYYWNSINYKQDRMNPNFKFNSAIAQTPFFYSYRESGAWRFSDTAVTDIDPTQYDDGTDLAPVEDHEFTLQIIFYEPSLNITFVQYGQSKFINASQAIASVNANGIDINPLLSTVAIRGVVITRGNATNLSDYRDATIINGSQLSDLKLMPLEIEDGISALSQLNSGGTLAPYTFLPESNGTYYNCTD